MRITGGQWKGRRLPELKGFAGRPTTDREGLFNLLSSRVDVEGAHVLDLFAGTGVVRLNSQPGAGSVTAVEKAPKACRFMTNQRPRCQPTTCRPCAETCFSSCNGP